MLLMYINSAPVYASRAPSAINLAAQHDGEAAGRAKSLNASDAGMTAAAAAAAAAAAGLSSALPLLCGSCALEAPPGRAHTLGPHASQHAGAAANGAVRSALWRSASGGGGK